MNSLLTKKSLVALIFVAMPMGLLSCKPDKEALIQKLISQIREGRFEELYDQSSGAVPTSVTRMQFVQRMGVLVSKLKTIDVSLSFQKAPELENNFVGSGDSELLIRAFQKLEKDGKGVEIAFYLEGEGTFFDLWVSPKPGTPAEYKVPGILCKECLNQE